MIWIEILHLILIWCHLTFFFFLLFYFLWQTLWCFCPGFSCLYCSFFTMFKKTLSTLLESKLCQKNRQNWTTGTEVRNVLKWLPSALGTCPKCLFEKVVFFLKFWIWIVLPSYSRKARAVISHLYVFPDVTVFKRRVNDPGRVQTCVEDYIYVCSVIVQSEVMMMITMSHLISSIMRCVCVCVWPHSSTHSSLFVCWTWLCWLCWNAQRI